MEFNVQLPSDAIERRRLQNRIAQRKFRQKRDQQRRATIEDSAHVHNSHAPLSSRSELAILESDTVALPSLLQGVTALQDDSSARGPSLNTLSTLEDVNSWNVDAGNEIRPGSVTAPASDITLPSPSQISWEPNLTLSNDIIGQVLTPPSSTIRKPLRYRRSAQLNEYLDPARQSENEDGWIGSLHIAARKGNDRMVEILLEQGPDCDEKDSDGRTPLMHAVIKGHEAVTRLLLEHGAAIGLVDHDARSALHWAALYRREELLRMLLERRRFDETDRFDVDAYDDSGWTPLHTAIYQDFEPGVRMLLQAGANLDSKAQKCPYARKLDSLALL
ncbi:ankyrin repeat-containing domain protein [Hypoxylon sp. NC1633]|nr:ankyrin repeat-containing domain protein [Hypoxylon sp. NC1633]